jgi:2-phosphosulfolactate phosphatase
MLVVSDAGGPRPWLLQGESAVRFEWGPSGVSSVPADAVVVVDVLRFTTAVDAAVSRGAIVHPYRWKDESMHRYAHDVGAVLADPGASDGPSLSPVSLLSLEAGDRVVLPSPNGSACAAIAHDAGATVYAACLRNATAVGDWLDRHHDSVTVIACGERWPDGSLRPALEDYLGAGAVLAALDRRQSPEARAAADAWRTASPWIVETIEGCVSGREAIARGWARDVDFACRVDASDAVPVLRAGGFVDCRSPT